MAAGWTDPPARPALAYHQHPEAPGVRTRTGATLRRRTTLTRIARQLGAAVARDQFAFRVDPRHGVPSWWADFPALAASRAAGELFLHLSSDEDFVHGAAARAAASEVAAAVAAELLDSSRVAEWWPAARAALTPQEPR